MIDRTFQLIPGVGPWREKDLWARGVLCWDDFPAHGEVAMSAKLDQEMRGRIAAGRRALVERDLAALATLLPAREHWRLYGHFADQAVFLDIEADGSPLSPTVVGLLDPEGVKTFIQGRNLDALPPALERWPIWVTFNGACFDLPVLRQAFPALRAPLVHLDLRFVGRKVGWTGGLKSIEDELGLGRPLHLRGLYGSDAVALWRTFQASGDLAALRRLVEYNLYDAFHLRTLMDVAFNDARDRLGFDDPPRPVFDRGDILYDVTKLLLSLARSSAAATEG